MSKRLIIASITDILMVVVLVMIISGCQKNVLPDDIPDEFWYAPVSVPRRVTTIQIDKDRFTGKFNDISPYAPEIEISEFEGSFEDIKMNPDGNYYTMHIGNVKYDRPIGEEWEESEDWDGEKVVFHYTETEADGLDNGREYTLFLPGEKVIDTSDEFQEAWKEYMDNNDPVDGYDGTLWDYVLYGGEDLIFLPGSGDS